ncbi:MAG: transporter substrate-binding domain-containing protein [bacterium]
MKKKILAVVLSSMMALGLAACGGTASSKTTSKTTSSAATSATTSAASSTSSVESTASSATSSVESTVSSVTSSVESTESTESSVKDVPSGVEDGVLTVGFDAEYPPYGYMDDNGEYTGFDLELAEKVCEMEGWKLEKKPINWDAKDMELNSGAIDCIWNGFTRNGREDDYQFSISYVDNSQVIVVAENSGIEKLADLAGKNVGVQAASAALTLLETPEEEDGHKELADTFASLNQFADYNTAFTELQAGALDALAIDIGVAKYQINSRGEGFKILEENLNEEEYAVGFRKGNTELAGIINFDLVNLYKNGTMMELAEKYEIADMIIHFQIEGYTE